MMHGNEESAKVLREWAIDHGSCMDISPLELALTPGLNKNKTTRCIITGGGGSA
jgi:hypothetical protein